MHSSSAVSANSSRDGSLIGEALGKCTASLKILAVAFRKVRSKLDWKLCLQNKTEIEEFLWIFNSSTVVT